MTDHKKQFKNWMAWRDNELNIYLLVKPKSSPPAIQPPTSDATGMVFDHFCEEIGITDVIRRRNMVRFKNTEDLAMAKLTFKNLDSKKIKK